MLKLLKLTSIFTLCLFWQSIESAAVMSVDLGGEWIKVGVVSPMVSMDIALNKETKRKTPSAVAFRNFERSFGEDALLIQKRKPHHAYFHFLDLIGKTIDNPMVKLYQERFPFYEIVPDERNAVTFKSENGTFTVEELIAQILWSAKGFAEDTAGQKIVDCVLTVPGFFGQAERLAILTAANLSGLNVLQLINDYTAVALNFGVSHSKTINETAKYYIFYDMGSHSTTAAVVSYQLEKDKVKREVNPVIQILGVGFNRTLGGLEVQIRLRNYLADEFNKLKKINDDIKKNPRAMVRLFKAADELKKVLSANNQHTVRIESLVDNHNFELMVTRDKLIELIPDILSCVHKPIEQALYMAGLSLDIITQVVVFGGGTRIPAIQDTLTKFIKQDLGKTINTDEAAALGAVYKAADLSLGFMVKKFVIKEGAIFPIQIAFQGTAKEGNTPVINEKLLFGQMNTYPQKKAIKFYKKTADFDFQVKYAQLNSLTPQEISYMGNLTLTKINVKGVKEILEKHKKEDIESYHTKSYFVLDESGIFYMTNIEHILQIRKNQDYQEESTLSKLGSTISKLFSGNDKETQNINEANENNQTKESESQDHNNTDTNTTDPNIDKTPIKIPQKNETIKLPIIKESLDYNQDIYFLLPMQDIAYELSLKKLNYLNEIDQKILEKEHARNSLESFLFDIRDRLDQKEFLVYLTEIEHENISKEISIVSEWLDIYTDSADTENYQINLKKCLKLIEPIKIRKWEHENRPNALKKLNSSIKNASEFLTVVKNLTENESSNITVFTIIELQTLENLINTTIDWKIEQEEQQNKLKLSDKVLLTVRDIEDHISSLNREVNYLINKLKTWENRIKTTIKPKTFKKTTNETDSSKNTTDIDSETVTDKSDKSEEAPTPHGEL